LEDPKFFMKIFQLDEHIGSAVAGLISDARVLIEQSRVYCQSNRLLYDEPVDIEVLTKRIGDQAQVYTQHAGVRPYGVSMILAGLDKTGSRVFTVDPSGSYRGYKAVAVGRKNDEGNTLLEQQYRDDLSLDEAISLAIEAVKIASEPDVTSKIVKVAVVPEETRVFRRLSQSEVEKYFA
jgi:proteasome alpha subunit